MHEGHSREIYLRHVDYSRHRLVCVVSSSEKQQFDEKAKATVRSRWATYHIFDNLFDCCTAKNDRQRNCSGVSTCWWNARNLLKTNDVTRPNRLVCFTCKQAIQRKNMFEYLRNCSKRNFGRNVRMEYLLVLIRFVVNLVACGPLLIVIIRFVLSSVWAWLLAAARRRFSRWFAIKPVSWW